ncbi:hypothetical protein Pmani_008441 [Petrolisthes manimaculis]|uniref:CCHC-type domain-containing protein n=1 Tax=Petrolisthes manimaculis TaxID=1843537 RepID=A0AAE1UIZ1_9EUCA|nr:hypothetical protein Pmani_008441 [Petrolisthes manimaculis]
MTPAGNVLITPPDAHTFHLLKNITKQAKWEAYQLHTTTSAILLHYPIAMPLQPLLNHPKVIEAKHCIHSSGIPTMQIQFTITGPLPPYLKLGNWGTFYTRPYTKEPLRCFKCQRFGHHKAHCHQPEVCAVCSSPHATEVCLKNLKEQQPTTAKWITKHGTGIVQLEELWYKLGMRNKQHGSSQTSQHLPQQNNKT